MKRLFDLLLIIIIALWFGVSFLRTIYNISKLFSEELSWIRLSNTEKRSRLYGDIFFVLNALGNNQKKQNKVLLLSSDGKIFFLMRYHLYPQKIFWVTSKNELMKIAKNYKNIVVYNPDEFSLNESFILFTKYKIDKIKDQNNKIIAYYAYN